MILKNVEINWARLDEENPDMGFTKDQPQWNLVAVTRDKDQAMEFKGMNLNVKTDEDDKGIIYKVSLKKAAVKKDGSKNKPVPVVGGDLMPLADVTEIGNGSVGNVKIRQFEYNFNGREGIGTRLESVQIVKLVKYEGKKAGAVAPELEGFEAIASDDTSMDEENAFD